MFGVGAAVPIGEAIGVGALVLGWGVGALVGLGVGASVGWGVDSFVGSGVGASEGWGDGLLVGALVGT